MKILKIIFCFIKDLNKARKDNLYSGHKSSYYMMRYLYYLSDGLLLIILSIIIKVFSLPSKFLKSYEFLNPINKRTADDIKNEIFKLNVFTNKKSHQNIPLMFNNEENYKKIDFGYYKKNNLVRLNFSRQDLLSNKIISQFIINNDFSKKIEKIIGNKVYLLTVDAWITLPVPKFKNEYELMTVHEDTQNWHRDVDNLRDLKVMIYLNDVISENDGPFQIIEGTNAFNYFNFFNYIDKIKFRVSNKYVLQKYTDKLMTFTGKKGTCFLVDTRALHRGKPIKKEKYRIVLQLYYSTHLFGKDKKILLDKRFDSYELWKDQISNNKFNSLFY